MSLLTFFFPPKVFTNSNKKIASEKVLNKNNMVTSTRAHSNDCRLYPTYM